MLPNSSSIQLWLGQFQRNDQLPDPENPSSSLSSNFLNIFEPGQQPPSNPKNWSTFFTNILCSQIISSKLNLKYIRKVKRLKKKPNSKNFNNTIILAQGGLREFLEIFFSTGRLEARIMNSRANERLKEIYLQDAIKIKEAFRERKKYRRRRN